MSINDKYSSIYRLLKLIIRTMKYVAVCFILEKVDKGTKTSLNAMSFHGAWFWTSRDNARKSAFLNTEQIFIFMNAVTGNDLKSPAGSKPPQRHIIVREWTSIQKDIAQVWLFFCRSWTFRGIGGDRSEKVSRSWQR